MKKIKFIALLTIAGLISPMCSYAKEQSNNDRHSSREGWKGQRNNNNKAVIMSEEEQKSMKVLLDESKNRRIKAMGKIPTEESIKNYIDKIVKEFNQSDRKMKSTEKALFALADVRVAIREFKNKLKAVDLGHGSSTHIRFLYKKFRKACEHVEDNGQFILGIDEELVNI